MLLPVTSLTPYKLHQSLPPTFTWLMPACYHLSSIIYTLFITDLTHSASASMHSNTAKAIKVNNSKGRLETDQPYSASIHCAIPRMKVSKSTGRLGTLPEVTRGCCNEGEKQNVSWPTHGKSA